jgi:integrase
VPVAKRVRNGQVTWRARWRDDTGAQRSKSFRRKVDAERFMTNLDHGRLNGAYVDPSAGRMTVGEWSERWMRGQVHLKPKTRASYESLLRCWVLPRWEKVPLAKVTFGAVAEWVGTMTLQGLSASRTRQAYHVLTGMLDDAVKDGRLVRNPAAGVDLPRIEARPRRYLRHDQLHALAAACGPYQVLVLTLGYCGLRWGEAAALRVHNVDLDRGRIEVSRAVAEVNGRIVVGSPKSHQSRWLPVPGLLLDGLKEQVAGKDPEDLVFPSPHGSFLRVQNFRRGFFDRAVAGIGMKGFYPHELRHTAASLAIASGASVKAVQRMLGHASATLTLDRYGHLFPDEMDALAASLDNAMRGSGVVPMWSQAESSVSREEESEPKTGSDLRK